MNDYWYLCGRTGIIKYAGKFEDYDDADEGIRQINIDCIWIFSECPEVETPVGGNYNLVVGDLVTVEVTGSEADATISGCPEGIVDRCEKTSYRFSKINEATEELGLSEDQLRLCIEGLCGGRGT